LNIETERLAAKGETAVAADISALAESMRRHVERELARARRAFPNRDTSASVRAAVERVIRVVERTPDAQRLDLSVDVAEGLAARIDADDLAEALGNLVENAARHARRELSIHARMEAGQVLIAISDDGAGIPLDRQAEALSRGGRLDQDGPGAGLGLSIVTDIAAAWGGMLSLDEGSPGVVATLSLPSASA
jgi:signal transduction histidine kinase